MTLTIEDGTGVDGADSFNTVAECADHAVAYFGESLAGSDAMKESALRRAWVYMSALSWKTDDEGKSLWPTFGGTIPDAVRLAQSALARAEFKAVNHLSPEVTVSGKKVLTGVKGITWEVQSGPNTVEAARPVLPMVMDLLKPYLAKNPAQSGGTFFLERA
jgi:hypothetical protein